MCTTSTAMVVKLKKKKKKRREVKACWREFTWLHRPYEARDSRHVDTCGA